ncbi:MAG: YbaB/EbfC family nucleoid-associated protein [Caldilineaceae bacterium]|nr:YbaB/EbfC family nucleoid-associated protein [Caldilineaceae bacterium]
MVKKKKRKTSGGSAARSGFPSAPGGGGMGNLMSQMQKLQAEMESTQEELADEEVTVSVGGGMVTVVATGRQEIKSIKIQPEAVDPDDVEMLEDLVLAAVTEALQKSQELADERLGGLTSGMGLPPGLGL